MKTLYLDLGMGAAGDMLSAALLELIDDKEAFIKEMNDLGIPHVKVLAEKAKKCGITGTHVKVLVDGEEEHSHDHYEHEHDHHSHEEHSHHHHHDEHHHHEHGHDDHHHHEHNHKDNMGLLTQISPDGRNATDVAPLHHHASMADIENIINSLKVSDKVKSDVINVYKLIAEAESKAHDAPVYEIHFHEVGTMDAIADVTMVCSLMEKLDLDCVMASPVHVGSGHVHCAHGILPVPAPATAYILKNVPIYGGEIKGELCTPTGAALLKYFVDSFGDMPAITIEKYGYGMGNKDFEMANCVRAMLGEVKKDTFEIVELSCNIDDMTAEKIGFAMDILFEAGALEVYTIPVGMKKSRPGTLLCVMCNKEKRDQIIELIFKHTTTLGIRENISRRYTLERSVDIVSTKYGDVRVKDSKGYGATRRKFEYDDLAKIAKETGKSLKDIEHEIAKEIK